MLQVSSIATDAQGRTWATEAWNYPRRVSVWGKDGKLIRDYIDNTGYAGSGSFLHDQDPSLAYYGPVEMKLDRASRTWKVSQVLWVPEAGENFPIIPGYEHSFTVPQRFRAKIDGKDHEYLFQPSQGTCRPYVVYLEAAIPLAALQLNPQPGASLKGDVGFISSDAEGKINTARTYWANPSTNLVSDEPIEAWLSPAAWGEFTWGK